MQVKFVVISSVLLFVSGSVQGAPIPRDLGSDVSRIVQDVERIANDVASVAGGVIKDLPPFLQAPASSIFNEVTAGAAKGFAEVTSILGDFVTIAPPTATVSAPSRAQTPAGGVPVVNGGAPRPTTRSSAFQIPGTPLTTSNPLADLFGLPGFEPTGTVSGFNSKQTFAPSDLAALLNSLMSQNGVSAGSGSSFSVSFGSPIATTSTPSSLAVSTTSSSPFSVSSASVTTSAPVVSASSSASVASTTTSNAASSTSATNTAPAIGRTSFATIDRPVDLPGQPVTAVSNAASATGAVYPNVPSKRGLGSLIGIVGSEIGPLLQEADQFGNKVASIGNKVIAALPSDIQAPASSFFAQATAEVGKGFSFVTSIAGPIAAIAPTSTPTTTATATATATSTSSASSTGTPAAQNAAAQTNGAMSISQMAGSTLGMAASIALGALIAF